MRFLQNIAINAYTNKKKTVSICNLTYTSKPRNKLSKTKVRRKVETIKIRTKID